MRDDVTDIAAFYDDGSDAEHVRLDEHQLEFDLTLRYLEEYLPCTSAILEIGAATGRYTLELAKHGHDVTAVDLSPVLIDECKLHLADAGLADQVRFVVADARDLSAVNDDDFDAVLIMGPLYHLVRSSDRGLALAESLSRLRSGGLIFSTFLSRFGVLGDLMTRVPQWIDDADHVRALVDVGRRPENAPRGGFRGYFALPSEIVALHEDLGIETIAFAGVEPVISSDDAKYNDLHGEERTAWLDLLFEISIEPSIVGASRHLLYIGRKP